VNLWASPDGRVYHSATPSPGQALGDGFVLLQFSLDFCNLGSQAPTFSGEMYGEGYFP